MLFQGFKARSQDPRGPNDFSLVYLYIFWDQYLLKGECNEENNEKCVKLGKPFFHKSFMQYRNAAHVIYK